MSYDVTIGDQSFNYTSNVSDLFYDHIVGGLPSLDGLTGKQAGERLRQAFKAINDTRNALWSEGAKGEPEFCAKYDAPNGWGSAIGGILFLARIFSACAQHPRSILRVSS